MNTKEIIKKKLIKVSEWVLIAREAKDWKTYDLAVREYTRLANILKSL